MPTALTSEPVRQESRATAEEIFARASVREQKLSRLLVFYISGGLLFMLLPGTFLGVWNLISISGRRAAESISPAWIQAHGHAQVLGWIGSFILGIGFYSIPKLRGGLKPFALWSAWLTGAMWMTGVLLRWLANVYLWQWRVLLPVSAGLELAAFLIFFRAVSQHKPEDGGKKQLDTWILVVIAGTVGLLATLMLNLGATLWLAVHESSPAFPQPFDQRFLVLAAWGFMVPFVWGFSAKWLPIFLGTQPPINRLLGSAVLVHWIAIGLGLAGFFRATTVLILLSSSLAIVALRIFAKPEKAAKIKAIHASFPFFVRSAYVWLLVAAMLGVWAANAANPAGIWGASRHALTGGIHCHDGFLRWSTGSACVFRDAAAVQQQTHVCRTALTHGGVCASRQQRGPGLSGNRSGGVDVAPLLGDSRAFRRHDVRHQPDSHISAETCPAAIESDPHSRRAIEANRRPATQKFLGGLGQYLPFAKPLPCTYSGA